MKIYMCCTGAVGDILHATIIAKQLKLSNPGSFLTWGVCKNYAHVLKNNLYVDELVVVEGNYIGDGWKRAKDIINQRNFDFVCIPQITPDHRKKWESDRKDIVTHMFENSGVDIRIARVPIFMIDREDEKFGENFIRPIRDKIKIAVEYAPKSVPNPFNFNHYRELFSSLKKDYPEIVFILLNGPGDPRWPFGEILETYDLSLHRAAAILKRCDVLFEARSGWSGLCVAVNNSIPKVEITELPKGVPDYKHSIGTPGTGYDSTATCLSSPTVDEVKRAIINKLVFAGKIK